MNLFYSPRLLSEAGFGARHGIVIERKHSRSYGDEQNERRVPPKVVETGRGE